MPDKRVSHETLLDNLHDGVYFVDGDYSITYWNHGAERITGYSRGEIVGARCEPGFLSHVDKQGLPLFGGESPVCLSIADGKTREEELCLRNKNGDLTPVFARISPIMNQRKEVIGALEVFSDDLSRSQTRARIEELEEMALLCPLTGAGNRRYALLTLNNALAELRRYNWPFGLLFVDIDHFKKVNDTYGHNVGDEVLKMVAHALDESLRSFDFVGRWGGEEFIVLLPNITDEILGKIAERCRRLIEDSRFRAEGNDIPVTISIGAVLADPEDTAEQCVDRADRLLLQGKATGRNRVVLEP